MGTAGKSGRGKSSKAAPGRKSAARPAPRRKVSAKVYRRRRLVALLLVLAVLGGVVAGGFYLTGLLRPGAKNDAGAAPGASASAAPVKQAEKAGTTPAAVCDEAGIKVTASVDKPSYGAEEQPVLTLSVTNSGTAPCDINVGTSQMQYEITSGADIIYNSKNCQVDPTNLVKNLAPGASETANMVWKVNRNAPGCEPVASKPGRGGATYVLVATLGKWSSEKVSFTLQ